MLRTIACHTNSYGPYGGRAAIEQVRQAGLEWIELPIRTAGFRSRWGDEPLVTSDSAPAELAALDRMLSDHGVRVASCVCMAGSPLERANVELMKRKLDLAAHFDVRCAIGDAGAGDTDEQRHQIVRNLREIGEYAARLGITVCLDTHRGLCVNHRTMLHLLGEVDHPAVRVNFDTGNILYYNDNVHGEVALAKVCHLVRHVHLKDTTGGFGQWHFPALGRGGAVDFVRVFQILRDCGYRGPYSIVIEGIDGEGELPLAEHHRRVVESVSYLRELGYFD